jgi:hypothetical protein
MRTLRRLHFKWRGPSVFVVRDGQTTKTIACTTEFRGEW